VGSSIKIFKFINNFIIKYLKLKYELAQLGIIIKYKNIQRVKMRIFLKLLLASMLFLTGCSSSESTTTKVKTKTLTKVHDDKVIEFTKTQFKRNPMVELKTISIKEKKKVPSLSGWSAYILDISLVFKGKDVKISDIMFTNGTVITQNFFDLNTARSIRDSVMPNVTAKEYNKEHFLAGNPEGNHKVVIFSDPMCPFCIDYVPDVIKYIKDNTKDTALYYYHYPIETIHPSSVVIIKAILVAQQQGIKDALSKVYEAEFTPSGISQQESLDEFNKALGTSISLEDISNPKILEHYMSDLATASDLMVGGTPTIFVNGKRDNTKEQYKELK